MSSTESGAIAWSKEAVTAAWLRYETLMAENPNGPAFDFMRSALDIAAEVQGAF